MKGAGVDRAILVAPSWEGLRNDYVYEAFDRFPDQFRYMGRLDLEKPGAREQLPGWMKQRGILGMRHTFMRKHDREQLAKGAYDWLWEDCERYGVPLMVLTTDMRPKMEEILTRHPKLNWIIDHMGFSAAVAKEKRHEAAAADTIALARFPNVSVKLSAAPVYSYEPYPFRDMHGYIRRIIEAYGVERCFWGSDLSHLLHTCPYRECVTMFTEQLGLSAKELDWIMGRGLCEKLGWPV